MTTLIKIVAGWLFRTLGLLLLLVLALNIMPSVRDSWQIVEQFNTEKIISDASTLARFIVLDQKVDAKDRQSLIEDNLNQFKAERDRYQTVSCILPTCTLVKNASIYKIDAEIEAFEQALVYAEALTRGQQTCLEYKQNQPKVNELKKLVQELDRAKLWFFPVQEQHKNKIDELERREARQMGLFKSCQSYTKGMLIFQSDEGLIQKTLGTRHTNFLIKLNELKSIKEQMLGQVLAVLPTACWLLLGIILVPIGYKIIAFYVLAPLAAFVTTKSCIRIQCLASGELKVLSPNDYLQTITLNEHEELLFDHLFFRSASEGGSQSTKYLLDYSMPLTSIACGIFFLTKIGFVEEGTVTLSSNIKMLVLEIPEQSALVLHPRCLAGIVQNKNHPIRITRHWQLKNLGSWLTLRLRCVVFHGPAKLILKGSDGIGVDSSAKGISINQTATLGYTANLGYSVSRCGTFNAYYGGKQALFNDRFSTDQGYYLHEVGSRSTHKGPLKALTNPFEIIWDVLSSVMGI